MEKADAAKIPVLMIDTDANWDKKKAFVGTGNFKGGQIAGDFIAQKVGKGAEVAIIRGLLGDATHDARANGAIQELKAAGVNVVTIQPADSDRNKGMTVMQNILQTHPNIKAVFGTNDEMILGALRALQAAKKTDVITVGFDGSPDGLKSVIAGELTATVAQDAYGIGKMGVENAVKVAKGETIDKVIDTGTTLIDKSNAQALQDKIQKELGK